MTANDRQVGATHYQGEKIQHWDFVLMHKMPYMEAQVFKYVLRWKEKNGLEDLRKARHFLDKLIEYELGAQKTVVDVCSDTMPDADKPLTINELPGTAMSTKKAKVVMENKGTHTDGELEQARAALDGGEEGINKYLNPDEPVIRVREERVMTAEEFDTGEPQPHGYVDQG
jgi:hypothetical protein